jgi:hypothetical protein
MATVTATPTVEIRTMPLDGPNQPDGAQAYKGHADFDHSEFGPLDLRRYGWLKRSIIVIVFSPILLIDKLVSLFRR